MSTKKQFVKATSNSNEVLGHEFPDIPVITICEVKEESSKTILLNQKAIDVLKLNEYPSDAIVRIGITKGYVDNENSEVVPFIFGTTEEYAEILSEAGKIVKKPTALYNNNTGKIRSGFYHDTLTTYHPDLSSNEKYFLLIEEYTDGYWRLLPLSNPSMNVDDFIEDFGWNELKETMVSSELPNVEITLEK